MRSSKLLLGLATLVLGGVSFASFAPFFQEGPQVLDQHKQVQAGIGEWEGTITMHNMGPNPVSFPCTESIEGLGELWTVSHFQSDFMGMSFEGRATFGYDPTQEKFVGSWIDNMVPFMSIMEGTFDEKLDAIVMHYEGLDPMKGKVQMKNVSQHKDDTSKISFYELANGNETLTMVIEMKRKPKPVEAGASKTK